MAQRAGGLVDGPGLVPLRAVLGTVFLMHGGQKLFVWGIAGVTGFMASLGIPMPQVAAVVVTAVELLGGLAILAGFRARWAGLLLAGDMAVAILRAKLHGGFFSPKGFELELLLLGAALTLALSGSGGMSVDNALGRSRRG
jgi:putative oxidoreductase